MVIAPACQAGDRGFNPRRSRRGPSRGLFFRAVAQGLARSVRDREVGSSNLPSPTKEELFLHRITPFFLLRIAGLI